MIICAHKIIFYGKTLNLGHKMHIKCYVVATKSKFLLKRTKLGPQNANLCTQNGYKMIFCGHKIHIFTQKH